MQRVEHGVPRRNRIDLYTPAELAIREAMLAVEAAGCHELLTEAVTLLGRARDKVADFVALPSPTPARAYRKKPIAVEAVQWNGPADDVALERFAGHWVSLGPKPYITTPEGAMSVSPGDWVIRGVKGEYYPCKPDVFAATYEPVTG